MYRRPDRMLPRRRQPTGDSPREIVDATERLLETTSLADLNVEQILVEAGISRGTFYRYFESKNAVVAALARELWSGVFDTIRPFVERGDDVSPQAAIESSFREAWAIWLEHRAVFRAILENWHSVPELEAMWVEIIQRFTVAISAEIDRERAAGSAPPGADSRPLAALLLWSTAYALYVAGSEVDENMLNDKDIFGPVLSMWFGSIYGREPPADPRARKRSR